MLGIEIKSDKIKVGCCVIVNELDKPSCINVAIVTKIEVDLIEYVYLSKSLGKKNRKIKIDGSNRDSDSPLIKYIESKPTPLNDFGVRVNFYAGYYICYPCESLKVKSKYKDGLVRQWQGEECLYGLNKFNKKAKKIVMDQLLDSHGDGRVLTGFKDSNGVDIGLGDAINIDMSRVYLTHNNRVQLSYDDNVYLSPNSSVNIDLRNLFVTFEQGSFGVKIGDEFRPLMFLYNGMLKDKSVLDFVKVISYWR